MVVSLYYQKKKRFLIKISYVKHLVVSGYFLNHMTIWDLYSPVQRAYNTLKSQSGLQLAVICCFNHAIVPQIHPNAKANQSTEQTIADELLSLCHFLLLSICLYPQIITPPPPSYTYAFANNSCQLLKLPLSRHLKSTR